MAGLASLNRTSMSTPSLDKQSTTFTDSNPSDGQLRSMEAPLHVDTPLWNISTVGERRELLNGDTAKAEQTPSAESMGPTTRQAMVNGSNQRWLGGVVPYVLDPNLTPEERQEVLDGIDEIESKTNVSFVPLPDNDRDGVPDGGGPLDDDGNPMNYVRFQQGPNDGRANSHYDNTRKGEQVITTIGGNGDWGVGTVVHEIMHQLGFYHEHQHPDVNNPGNPFEVTPGPGRDPNFGELPQDAILLSYDPFSIMNYRPGTYQNADGQEEGTISVRPGGAIDINQVGEGRGDLSAGDINAINQHYGAEGEKRIPLGNGYTLHLENKDSAWRITDAEGNTVRVWGDPHVDENADGTDEWDFTQATTFMLDDTTKITVGTKGVGEGRSVTDTLTITNGDRAIVVTGIADNNVQIDSSQTNADPSEGGQSIDRAVDDGDVLVEDGGVNQWRPS